MGLLCRPPLKPTQATVLHWTLLTDNRTGSAIITALTNMVRRFVNYVKLRNFSSTLQVQSYPKSTNFCIILMVKKYVYGIMPQTNLCQMQNNLIAVMSAFDAYGTLGGGSGSTFDSTSNRQAFDVHSTANQRSLRSQWRNNPLATLTYLFIRLQCSSPDTQVGMPSWQMVVAWSNRSRIGVES